MRVLMIHPGPDFSVADVYRGWAKAFRALGCEVAEVNLNDRLAFYNAVQIEGKHLAPDDAAHLASKGIEQACYEFWPDVIVVVSAFFVADVVYRVWRMRPHKIVMLLTESPYEDDRQLITVERAEPDLVVVNDPTNLHRFCDLAPAMYVPHAYDPEVHYPGAADPDLIADFTFVGTGYPSRIEFLEAVDWSGLTVKLAGHWAALSDESPLRPFVIHDLDECIDNDVTADLYRAATASANLYRREANDRRLAHGWAMGPREVELAACKTFFLREPRPESDEVLGMLPSFSVTDPEDFGSQLRWWLRHDRLRERVSEAARAAIADRTFENHARRVLTRVT